MNKVKTFNTQPSSINQQQREKSKKKKQWKRKRKNNTTTNFKRKKTLGVFRKLKKLLDAPAGAPSITLYEIPIASM